MPHRRLGGRARSAPGRPGRRFRRKVPASRPPTRRRISRRRR